MNNAQLIQKLQELPPDAPVLIYRELSGMFESWLEITSTEILPTCQMRGHPNREWDGLYVEEAAAKAANAQAVCRVGEIRQSIILG